VRTARADADPRLLERSGFLLYDMRSIA